jgi:hypothetical protein
MADKELSYQILDLNGKNVAFGNLFGGPSPARIDFPDLPGGVYVLEIKDDGKVLWAKKLVINDW